MWPVALQFVLPAFLQGSFTHLVVYAKSVFCEQTTPVAFALNDTALTVSDVLLVDKDAPRATSRFSPRAHVKPHAVPYRRIALHELRFARPPPAPRQVTRQYRQHLGA